MSWLWSSSPLPDNLKEVNDELRKIRERDRMRILIASGREVTVLTGSLFGKNLTTSFAASHPTVTGALAAAYVAQFAHEKYQKYADECRKDQLEERKRELSSWKWCVIL